MGNLLKMLQAFDFKEQNPLADLQLSVNVVFPTILALQELKMNEKMRDNAFKTKQLWSGTEAQFNKSQKIPDPVKKPNKQGIAKSDKETTTYTLVYFNPESKKTEVIAGDVSINYTDETQQVIEESIGQRSIYGMYDLITHPLIREHIDERLLQEMMDTIKIETAPSFGGGVGICITSEATSKKMIETYGDKIIALQIAEQKKFNLEERLARHIQVIDEVVKNIGQPGGNVCMKLAKLPPLSKERLLALSKRKKRISKKEVQEILLKDFQFLKAAKQRISAMRIQDIFSVFLKIKK